MVRIQKLINSPVPSNCFVVYDKALSDKCIIVDSGGRSDAVLIDFLEKEGLTPQYIILTHEHFDHCWGVNELLEHCYIPIVCSRLCADYIKNEKKNYSVFYDNNGRFSVMSEAIAIEDIGYHWVFLGTTIIFKNTFGHTKVSAFFVDNMLFTGDTLIKDEKTVTKLTTGSECELEETMQFFRSLYSENYWV